MSELITILGGGLAGLSCSYHIGHESCRIFEKNSYLGGHIATHQRDGCLWDEGPHVSFTKNEAVRELLAESVSGGLLEYPTSVANWYQGHWIPHPAQSNLYAVPKPLADQCLHDFLASRPEAEKESLAAPSHYGEWLERAFGSSFAHTFSAAYTRKYWTCAPKELSVDWVGERVYCPDIATVKEGYAAPAQRNTHYITSVRYPQNGGFISFAQRLTKGAQVQLNHSVLSIDLDTSTLYFANGYKHRFRQLINTLPLDHFIGLLQHVPDSVRLAVSELRCSSLLLVNIRARGSSLHPYHWLYVYDENKYSTRITQTHLLSPNNVSEGSIGIQIETYASAYRPFKDKHENIAAQVVAEVLEMGLATDIENVHTQFVPYANVIFDHKRRENQQIVFNWLAKHGMIREESDLEPMTNWDSFASPKFGKIILAGRFAQWKYYWTDDCILRGMEIAKNI
jgi:protoporphyrinogen oxidase